MVKWTGQLFSMGPEISLTQNFVGFFPLEPLLTCRLNTWFSKNGPPAPRQAPRFAGSRFAGSRFAIRSSQFAEGPAAVRGFAVRRFASSQFAEGPAAVRRFAVRRFAVRRFAGSQSVLSNSELPNTEPRRSPSVLPNSEPRRSPSVLPNSEQPNSEPRRSPSVPPNTSLPVDQKPLPRLQEAFYLLLTGLHHLFHRHSRLLQPPDYFRRRPL